MSDSITPSSSLWHQQVVIILKWVWVFAILIGFGIYIIRNHETIVAQLQLITVAQFILSVGLILFGRIGIIIMNRDVLSSLQHPVPLYTLFRMVSISEIAKYLPGGVWHFVGRAGYYRTFGLSVNTISQALFKENAWLIISAGFIGALLLIAYEASSITVILMGVVIAIIWYTVIHLWGRTMRWQHILRTIAVQSVMWACIGLSFSIILPISLNPNPIYLSAGAFVLSWLIGFLAIFAPGGIGVREVVLVALMLPLLSSQESAVYAVTHRMLWVFVEFGMSLIAWIFFNENG
ncbi:MAG: hypothetical protein ACFE0Q_18720 [Anaerolineae bacterium]